MTYSLQQNSITASQLIIALSDIFPDSTYGAIPNADQFGVLEKYFARDGIAIAKAPDALLTQTTYRRHSK